MEDTRVLEFDTLVVGGGIAGLQSALDIADQGFQVAVVEKRCIDRGQDDPSIQGISNSRLRQLHYDP